MKMFVSMMVLVLAGSVLAEDGPKPASVQKEHEWLKQLEGEWQCESEAIMEPGKPPVKCKGTESARNLGGLWVVSEMKASFMGNPVNGMMTLGYDPQKKKYVGTWICSMSDHLCKYEGTVQGNVLTLETECPHPGTGKLVKMRDVIEVKNKDLKVMTSTMLGDDGKWINFMTATYSRTK